MQAPLAHDYDGIEWRPLDATVRQRIIVAPGYTAVVENDPSTDTETLIARIKALPDDVRSAELTEVWVALRPAEGVDADPAVSVSASLVGAEDQPLVSTLDDLRFEDDWAVVSRLPLAWASEEIEIELAPAAGWEYGITANRVPYGGYSATVASGAEEPQPLSGSIGFETIFKQSTDRSRLLEETVGPSLRSAVSDPFLIVVYAIILGMSGTIWAARRHEGRAG